MKFKVKQFSDIDINDQFFDSLKADYPGNANSTGFTDWFEKKAKSGQLAYVAEDDQGIFGFIHLKKETEPITLFGNQKLQEEERVKICTLKIDPRCKDQRIGEGAIGYILWRWNAMHINSIYVTVFAKHTALIGLLEKFGFSRAGMNLNGEIVLIKDRRAIDFSDPYKSFPFPPQLEQKANYIIIEDHYHDTMFPYSTLARNSKEILNKCVANGVSKIYVGAAWDIPYQIGQLVFVYRKDTQDIPGRGHRSCVTSYCTVTNTIMAKKNGVKLISFDELKRKIKNKSIFNDEEIRDRYENDQNVCVVELLYCGYFGKGNNINYHYLREHGLWPSSRWTYPTQFPLSSEQTNEIFNEANISSKRLIP